MHRTACLVKKHKFIAAQDGTIKKHDIRHKQKQELKTLNRPIKNRQKLNDTKF